MNQPQLTKYTLTHYLKNEDSTSVVLYDESPTLIIPDEYRDDEGNILWEHIEFSEDDINDITILKSDVTYTDMEKSYIITEYRLKIGSSLFWYKVSGNSHWEEIDAQYLGQYDDDEEQVTITLTKGERDIYASKLEDSGDTFLIQLHSLLITAH